MNKFISDIITNYKDWFKEFIVWYKDNYSNGIDIKVLINVDSIYLLSIIHRYLNIKYNIGIMYDTYNYNVYIIDPKLKVNEILDNYNKNGEFTHVIIKEYGKKKYNTHIILQKGIIRVLEEIHNEF